MHKGARDDPTLSFAKFGKFLFSSTTFVSFFFFFSFLSSVHVHKYIKYNPMGRLCYGPTLLCTEWFLAVRLVYLSWFKYYFISEFSNIHV